MKWPAKCVRVQQVRDAERDRPQHDSPRENSPLQPGTRNTPASSAPRGAVPAEPSLSPRSQDCHPSPRAGTPSRSSLGQSRRTGRSPPAPPSSALGSSPLFFWSDSASLVLVLVALLRPSGLSFPSCPCPSLARNVTAAVVSWDARSGMRSGPGRVSVYGVAESVKGGSSLESFCKELGVFCCLCTARNEGGKRAIWCRGLPLGRQGWCSLTLSDPHRDEGPRDAKGFRYL
jgi:hypothetical protein